MQKKKSYITLIFLMVFSLVGKAQPVILNGSFELNGGITFDKMNLTNQAYDSLMSYSTSFGNSTGVDIVTSATWCQSGAQEGNWYLFLATDGLKADSISLKLSSPIYSGYKYTMTFYDRVCSGNNAGKILIGVSNDSNKFGTLINTVATSNTICVWTNMTFSFIAPIDAMYITISCSKYGNFTWIGIDKFTIYDCSPLPKFELGNDTSICDGTTLTLKATNSNASYLWQDNSTDSIYTVSKQGNYWAKVTNSCGSKIDSIHITTYLPPALNLEPDTDLCYGSTIILKPKINPYFKYLWNTGDTTPQLKIIHPGKYSVVASNGNCITSDSTNVKLFALPSLHLPPDTVICFDDIEKVILDAGKFKSYFWYPTGETSESIAATLAQQYVVVVTDTNNCVNKDTTLVEEKCGSKIYIPNAFTPNGDGINDVFYVHSRSLETFEIRIYDRWGEQVFSSTDISKGWDGTFQNLPCMCETYVWQMKYKIKGSGSTQTANGNVMLLR